MIVAREAQPLSRRPRGRPRKSILTDTPSRAVILGIDPGLASTGYAVAEVDVVSRKIVRTIELGTIKTEREQSTRIRRTSDDYRRARYLHRQLLEITTRHKIAVAAQEMVTTSPYARPSLNFGIMLGLVASFEFFLIEVLPQEVKKAVTGNKHAKKADIIKWALELTQNDDVHWPTSARQNRMDLQYRARHLTLGAEHQADALAVIQAALQTEQLHESISLQQALSIP